MTSAIRLIASGALCLGLAAAPALAQDEAAMPTASATILGLDGAAHGTVSLRQTPHGVLLMAELTGVPPGVHGLHIHETGACDASEGFMSAGDHFAGANDSHGYLVAGGPHAGDMPNIHVPDGGALTVEVFNPRISLVDGAGFLLDADGSALMIHAGADDYESQPSGDAGDMIACGVIASD